MPATAGRDLRGTKYLADTEAGPGRRQRGRSSYSPRAGQLLSEAALSPAGEETARPGYNEQSETCSSTAPASLMHVVYPSMAVVEWPGLAQETSRLKRRQTGNRGRNSQ